MYLNLQYNEKCHKEKTIKKHNYDDILWTLVRKVWVEHYVAMQTRLDNESVW